MDAESTRLAHALTGLGVGHGDRIATLLDNRAEQVVSFFAAMKLGAVQVPINTGYKGEFLRHQLADSGASVFIVQGEFASRAVETVGPETTPAVAHCITVDPPDAVIDVVPTITWAEALAAGSDTPIDTAQVRPSDLACFIYTAGTTGPSKGCMLPQNYIVSLADQVARAWGRRPDDVVLTPLPLFHFNAISIAVVGHVDHWRERGDRAEVLGEQLLAGDQAHRRHDGLDARLARDPDRERRRPSRSARPQAAPERGRSDAARHGSRVAGALRLQDLQRRVRAHGGLAGLDARRGRAQQAGRGRQAQPARLRCAHRRRRRRRGRPAGKWARSCAGRTARI